MSSLVELLSNLRVIDPSSSPQDQLVQVLKTFYDPTSSREQKQAATEALNAAKCDVATVDHCFTIASGHAYHHEHAIRLGALGILQDIAKALVGKKASSSQASALKACIFHVADSLTDDDKRFYRSKVAKVWFQLARKVWPENWIDMDRNLHQIWDKSLVHKLFVAEVLEELSESSSCDPDEPSALEQASAFNREFVKILTPESVLVKVVKNYGPRPEFRFGAVGWFHLLVEDLKHFAHKSPIAEENLIEEALGLLKAVRAASSQVMLQSVDPEIFGLLLLLLQEKHLQIQTETLQILIELYARASISAADISEGTRLLVTEEGLSLLHHSYVSVQIDVEDIDEEKHLYLQSISQLLQAMASYYKRWPDAVAKTLNKTNFASLLLEVVQHPSPKVAFPVLIALWTFLSSRDVGLDALDAIPDLRKHLVQLCHSRMVRHEALPTDSSTKTSLFIQAEFEDDTERASFMSQVTDAAAKLLDTLLDLRPLETLEYILFEIKSHIDRAQYETGAKSDPKYNRHNPAALEMEAYGSLLKIALRLYPKHIARSGHYNRGSVGDELNALRTATLDWCPSIATKRFEDPMMQKHIDSMFILIASHMQPDSSDLPFALCKEALGRAVPIDPASQEYLKAFWDMLSAVPYHLHGITSQFHNSFINYVMDLKDGIDRLEKSSDVPAEIHTGFLALLLRIVYNAPMMPAQKNSWLNEINQRLVSKWEESNLVKTCASLSEFCKVWGMTDIAHVLSSSPSFSASSDWSSTSLGQKARALGESATNKQAESVLSVTKQYFDVFVQDLDTSSRNFYETRKEWRSVLGKLLPVLLSMIRRIHELFATSLSDTSGMDIYIVRKLIASGKAQFSLSKDTSKRGANFQLPADTVGDAAYILNTKSTHILQLTYSNLKRLCQFEDIVCKDSECPTMIWTALFDGANSLPTGDLADLVVISSHLIICCSEQAMDQFLAPFLKSILNLLRTRLMSDWIELQQSSGCVVEWEDDDSANSQRGDLKRLDKAGSALIACLLGHKEKGMKHDVCRMSPVEKGRRRMIFANADILYELLQFCRDVLAIHVFPECWKMAHTLRFMLDDVSGCTRTESRTGKNGNRLVNLRSDGPNPLPDQLARDVMQYYATSILSTALDCLIDPNCDDRDVALANASLIENIVYAVGRSHSGEAEKTMCRLNGLPIDRVQYYVNAMDAASLNHKTCQKLVIEMLEPVRDRLGMKEIKIKAKSHAERARVRAGDVDSMEAEPTGIVRGGSPEAGAIGDLFGE